MSETAAPVIEPETETGKSLGKTGAGCPVTAAGGGGQAQYRNLFGTPAKASDLYQGLPAQTQEARTGGEGPSDTKKMLEKLAICCGNGFDWQWQGLNRLGGETPLEAGQSIDESRIPAGYTYFAQFVAHDMVHTATGLDAAGASGGRQRNFRVTPLVLDTLYGGGPIISPLAYEIGNRFMTADQHRVKFVVGRSKKQATDHPTDIKTFRDIGRANCPFERKSGDFPSRMISGDEGTDFARLEPRRPLISDPRNDDNMFLSQLLVAFYYLHSSAFNRLMAAGLPAANTPLKGFRLARQIVTLIFRDIVRKDLLNRLLSPNVATFYENKWDLKAGYIDTTDDYRMPVEFSHAAYRFGHAMIRPHYAVNEMHSSTTGPVSIAGALEFTSDGGRRSSLPLTEDWWVQWRHFFDFGAQAAGETPQKARRIGPGFVEGLDEAQIVPHFDESESSAVFLQDVLRSAQSSPRNIGSLYTCLPDELIPQQDGLHRGDTRKSLLKEWFDARITAKAVEFEPREIQSLTEDPPLSFYVLFEAAVEAKGYSLGLLGSVIVAETIYRALEMSRPVYEDNQQLDEICDGIFGAGSRPADMASMIAFIDRDHDIRFI